jgi:K+-sensing histidine kinase KdpD
LALIETILDSAKIEAGRFALAPSAGSLAAVAADAIRNVRQMAGGRPFDVELELDDDLPTLWADGPRLAQALSALIWFSARAGDPSLSQQGVRAVVHARRISDRLIGIDLDAPGCTISGAVLEELLDPAPGVVDRRKYGMLALGLGLARSLVLQHGGTLKVRRDEAAMARFELVLPVGGPSA